MEPTLKGVVLMADIGTRMSEENHLWLKPMIEIGGKPLLLHVNSTRT